MVVAPSSQRNVWNQNEMLAAVDSDLCELGGPDAPHPTGITLRRVGYYTIPSMDQLANLVDADGRCLVDNFTVGRYNYGNIFFPDSFDVAGLNLDEIVHFRHKEVTVYPDESRKPPLGEGLNRPAQVTLDRVWPLDKVTREPVSDPAALDALDYETTLRHACAKMAARFKEYRPQTGSWVFKVDHFSKYGLSDSDEDEQPVSDIKKLRLNSAPPQTFPPGPKDLGLKRGLDGAWAPPPQSTPATSLLGMDEDDHDMEDELIKTPFDLDENYQPTQLSPTMQLARQMGASAHKVQLMKASFFPDEVDDFHINGDFIDYKMGTMLDVEELDQGPKLFKSFPLFRTQFSKYEETPPPMPFQPVSVEARLSPACPAAVTLPVAPPVPAVKPQHRTLTLPDRGVVCYPQSLAARPSVAARCAVDLALFKGRSFRVGWAADGVLASLSTHKVARTVDWSLTMDQLATVLEGRGDGDTSPAIVQRIRVLPGHDDTSNVSFQASIEQHLQVALEHSLWSEGEECPRAAPRAGVQALHAHCDLALNSPPHPWLLTALQVWQLCVALWGNLPDLDPHELPTSHHAVMVRRQAVSDWLENVVAEKVRGELVQDTRSAANVLYMSISVMSAELPTSHHAVMVRRQAVSDWLENVVAEKVRGELVQDTRSAANVLYMSISVMSAELPTSHHAVMVRRQAVSDWLENVVAEKVRGELVQDTRSAANVLYMSISVMSAELPTSHHAVMVRRQAVSDWLENVVAEKVRGELVQDTRSAANVLYMSISVMSAELPTSHHAVMVRRQAVSDWLENVVAEKVRGELVQDTRSAANVLYMSISVMSAELPTSHHAVMVRCQAVSDWLENVVAEKVRGELVQDTRSAANVLYMSISLMSAELPTSHHAVMVRRQAVSDWLENVVAEKVRGELVQDTRSAANVLYMSISVMSAELPTSHHAVMVRRQAVSDWLENVVAEKVRGELVQDTRSAANVFSLLTGHCVLEACEQATAIGDVHASLLLAQVGGCSSARVMMEQQLTQWVDTEADKLIDKDRLKLMMLVAGRPLLHTSDALVNVCENLVWKRAFAIHLWYVCSPVASVTDALLRYEAAFSDDDETYAAAPLPGHLGDAEWESSRGRPIYDVCYHLLKLFSSRSHPLAPLLNPATHSADPLDHRLSWLLLCTVEALGYTHVSAVTAANLHTAFAAQLEAHGLWHWAVFVLQHLSDPQGRRRAVLDVLGRHISLSQGGDVERVETFLITKLHIPAQWVYQAKAIKAAAHFKHKEAAMFLLDAEQWNEAHKVIIQHIAAKAIINDKYQYLENLLKKLAPHSKVISNWSHEGALLLDYLSAVHQVSTLMTQHRDNTIGYHLERLQPLFSSLCTRIPQLPTPTAIHRLCQVEIAKRAVSLIRTVLILQKGKDSEQTMGMSMSVLANLVNHLPLPEEYSKQELLEMIGGLVGTLGR